MQRSITAWRYGLATGLVALGWMAGTCGWGQAKAATGTVRGRVVCSDTRGPARFAQVSLIPLPEANAPKLEGKAAAEAVTTTRLVTTDLQGGFVLRDVKPGRYYVAAEKVGYQSARAIPKEEMRHPTVESARRMEALLTPVLVTAERESVVEARVVRGASLSGTVRFDDGTADAGATVQLWRRDGKEWAVVHSDLPGRAEDADVNDRGEYRFSGLFAGEYLVSVGMQLSRVVTSQSANGSTGWSSDFDSKLDVYAPRAMRKKDAKPVTLGEGEDAADVAIEIPLSTMHEVSGALAMEGSGHPVNAGKVTLLFADDRTKLTSSEVSGEDERFHLNFVPEGDYIVQVTKAAEVTRTEVPYPPGTSPPTHTETKTLRTFGDAEQPLKLESEVSGLVVSVPAKKTGADAGATQAGAGTP